MAAFINTPEDMAWVCDVFHIPGAWGSAVLYGNEDAPVQVDLWYAAEPRYNQAPDSILTRENWPPLL